MGRRSCSQTAIVHTVAKDSTHKEIACELRITVPTVKAHMKNIMGKTPLAQASWPRSYVRNALLCWAASGVGVYDARS